MITWNLGPACLFFFLRNSEKPSSLHLNPKNFGEKFGTVETVIRKLTNINFSIIVEPEIQIIF